MSSFEKFNNMENVVDRFDEDEEKKTKLEEMEIFDEVYFGASDQINRGGRKQMKVGTNRRNARERNRVRHLNDCFEILRRHIPQDQHQKKLSKVDTLRSAMIYIENLRQLLNRHQTTSSFDR